MRERDSGWNRGGWLVAVLVLTRPQFVFLPPVLAAIELARSRTLRSTIAPLAPSLLLLALWFATLALRTTSSHESVAVFGPRHALGKVYEFDLWRVLPDSPARRVLEEERAQGHDAYAALARLTDEVGPDAWADVFIEVLRRAPGRLLLATARAIPRSFRQSTLWTPATPGAAFEVAVSWHDLFWGYLFWPPPMILVFWGLFGIAATTGFGQQRVRDLYAWTVVPVVAALFLAVAGLAMGTDQVGRLCLYFRPYYFMVLSIAAGATGQRLNGVFNRRGSGRWSAHTPP
jgi:hypothetical protein